MLSPKCRRIWISKSRRSSSASARVGMSRPFEVRMQILANSASVITPCWTFVIAICHMQTGRGRLSYAVSEEPTCSRNRVLAAALATRLCLLGSHRDMPPAREGGQHEQDTAPLPGVGNEPAAPSEGLIGRPAHATPAGELELPGEERFQLHRRHLRLRLRIRFPRPAPTADALGQESHPGWWLEPRQDRFLVPGRTGNIGDHALGMYRVVSHAELATTVFSVHGLEDNRRRFLSFHE